MFRRAKTLLRLLLSVRIRPRTLLLSVLLLGAIVAVYMHRAAQQRRAAAAIRRLGGTVAYDYQLTGDLVYPGALSWVPTGLRERLGDDFFHTVTYVHVTYRTDRDGTVALRPASDEFLSGLDQFPGLQSVALSFGPRSEDGLRQIGRLSRLKHLSLTSPHNLTDRGVECLGRLQCLESISLNGADITDESVRILGELPCLENLDLRDNRLTNQGLSYAGQMLPLKVLWVGVSDSVNRSITDEGLIHLASLPKLEGLDLEGTAVSELGLVKLTQLDLKWLRLYRTDVRDITRVQDAFPDCIIDR